MKVQYALKIISILVVSIGLLVALSSIEYKVQERDRYRTQAKTAIANGWSNRQVIVSPVLQLTLMRTYEEEVYDKNLEKYITKQRSRVWQELHLPDQLNMQSSIKMQERNLGIYQIPVYEAELILTGHFSKTIKLKAGDNLQKAELLASFKDMRGISNIPTIRWGSRDVEFQPGDNTRLLGNFISANISELKPLSSSEFVMRAKLRGLDAIHFIPLAKQVTASLESDWPHPYFEGRYLPVQRDISSDGFSARWEMTEFATSIKKSIKHCERTSSECANILNANSFGVGLHNPVDVYKKTDRSLKYGFLFIFLTFAAFLLLETVRQIQIHPIQYALVGCALAIFYLLLISLSEHISFLSAYTIAVLASVGLVGFYLRHVFKDNKLAVSMCASIGLLYLLLYMILKSEDYALLMGAILIFVCLGLSMIITRKIDWYELTSSKASSAETPELTNPQA